MVPRTTGLYGNILSPYITQGIPSSLSTPVESSCRLPIVTIGLSLTIFAVFQPAMGRPMDRRNQSSKSLAVYALKCISRQKSYSDI